MHILHPFNSLFTKQYQLVFPITEFEKLEKHACHIELKYLRKSLPS